MKRAHWLTVVLAGGAALMFLLLLSIPPASGLEPTSGSITGVVTYWGQEGDGLQIFVDAQIDLNQPPVSTAHIPSPGGDFSFTSLPDGTYYIGAWLDANESGGGPPDPGEPHVYYDANRDGNPDPVIISGGDVTDIDLDIAEVLVAREGVDEANCGAVLNPPCYSMEYALSNRALAGDTVLAFPGTYTETIAMHPDVVIISQAGPEATFIDGEGARGPMVTAGIPSIDRTARLEGFTIRGGNSSSSGAGLWVMGASPTISNCIITENTGGYGGGVAIAIPGADVLISHSRIIANTASGNAGGIQVTSEANLELVHSEVMSNTAGSWAGGILGSDNATVSIQDSLIQQNSASYGSGLMMAGAAGFSLLDSRVISNTAGSAAAVYVSDTVYEIEGNAIAGNVAAGNVGIEIRAGSDGTIVDNLILRNLATANIGGAITVEGATAAISGNQILSNTVEDQGGAGVYVTGASVVEIRSNTIADNQATGGAGILVGTGAEAVIEDNVIEHNQATLHAGGGIGIWAGGSAEIGQNWIADNTGGGIDIAGMASLENNMIVRSSHNTQHPDGQGQVRITGSEPVTLTNNTIAGNGTGYGVEIRATGSLSLTNNVVVDHAYGLYSDGATTPWLAHNDVWGNAITDYYGLDRGTTDISADPDFVDPAGDDYHLGTCSAAVDAGTNTGAPPVDYDGDVRPVNGHGTGSAVTDIGADERLAVTAPLPQAAFSYVADGWDVALTNESLNAISYIWDFGDGIGTSTEVDPTYTYSHSGPYTVTLTASCSFGCEDVHQEAVELRLVTIYLPAVLRDAP